MRACSWTCVCAYAVFLAGNALATDVTLHVGEKLPTSIETFPIPVADITCYLDTPSGDTLSIAEDSEDVARHPEKFEVQPPNSLRACAVNVVITGTEDEGTWRLHYKTSSGNTGEQIYSVTVENEDDPAGAKPTESTNEDRTIEYLEEKIFYSAFGRSHDVRINFHFFVDTESCHIVTPNGEEYNLADEDAVNALGVMVLKDSDTACGVSVFVQSRKSIGTWTLISRDTRHSDRIERRLNFTIIVEEYVPALPSDVIITEGSDMYVRLQYPIPYYETCKLTGPHGKTDTPHEKDPNHKRNCGFIVPNVQMNYAGRWEIVFGDSVTYIAPIQVQTNAAWEGAVTKLEWMKDRPVYMEVGPNHAIYCRISAPEGVAVFETFGRCTITLDRATEEHNGTWTMVVGLEGRVLTETHTVTVHVMNAAPRPQVITQVDSEQPSVLLTCAIQGQNAIRSCKFVDPSGRVLMAPQGVGEDRYSFHGVGVSLESNVTKSDCGLRITNPVAEEMGMWRCSVVSWDNQVHHGFLRVVLPWVTSEQGTVLPPTEPTLSASHEKITALEGDAVTMSCSIQSAIHYCYFVAQNGTVISISPRTVSDVVQYVGSGFDAGECGIRIRGLVERDSGPWSCRVGTFVHEQEQAAGLNVNIRKAMAASQRRYDWGTAVEAWVFNERPLEYCRFVRYDGFGFGTFSAHLPDHVTDHSDLSIGHCSIHIERSIQTALDKAPWTVVAKMVGQDVEVTASTEDTLDVSPPPPPPPSPPQVILVRYNYSWLLFFMLGLSLFAMSMSLSSKNNRRWVQQRATSLRNSFRKQPLQQPPVANSTAMAA